MATKSELILFLILFYSILGVITGLIGSSLDTELGLEIEDSKTVGGFGFSNVVSGFAVMGATFNTVFFGSFILFLAWIIGSSLPTINGGS